MNDVWSYRIEPTGHPVNRWRIAIIETHPDSLPLRLGPDGGWYHTFTRLGAIRKATRLTRRARLDDQQREAQSLSETV